jgi:hypothetical protein
MLKSPMNIFPGKGRLVAMQYKAAFSPPGGQGAGERRLSFRRHPESFAALEDKLREGSAVGIYAKIAKADSSSLRSPPLRVASSE